MQLDDRKFTRCRDAGLRNSGTREQVTEQLATLGRETCRKDKRNATRCLLWLNRATTFMTIFIRKSTQGNFQIRHQHRMVYQGAASSRYPRQSVGWSVFPPAR